MKCQLIMHLVRNGTVNVQYITSKEMAADVLTKPVKGEKHGFLSSGMGMKI